MGALVRDFLVVDSANSCGLDWSGVYWFAAYMQGMARRGRVHGAGECERSGMTMGGCSM